MADYGLAAALSEKRQRGLASNSALRSGMAIQGMDTSGYDLNPWQSILVNALKGFTGGALQGYGQNQVDKQYQTEATDLVSALKQKDPAMAIASNPSLAEYGAPYAIEQASDDATLQRQMRADRAKQLQELAINKGITVDPETGQPSINKPYTDALAESTRQQEFAKSQGQAQAASATFLTDPKQRLEQEGNLRKEFQATPEYQRFAQMTPIFQSLKATADDDKPSSSLNFLYGVTNFLDPGSTIREGDSIQIQRTGGLSGAIQGYISFVNGGGKLAPEQKKDLLDLAGSRYDEAKNVFDFKRSEYEQLASQNKLNPDNVVFFPETQSAKSQIEAKNSKSNIDLKAMSKALQQTESSNNPNAVGPDTKSGHAKGVMQLTDANSKTFGVQDPFNKDQNIAGGEKLLMEEIQRFGDPQLVIAAYNAGSPAVLAAIRKSQQAGGGTSFQEIARFLPAETVSHVEKTMPLYQQFAQAGPVPGMAPASQAGGAESISGGRVKDGYLYQQVAPGQWKRMGKVR